MYPGVSRDREAEDEVEEIENLSHPHLMIVDERNEHDLEAVRVADTVDHEATIEVDDHAQFHRENTKNKDTLVIEKIHHDQNVSGFSI